MELGNFFQVYVNYPAVLLSAVAGMVIGFLWYGPLFGKQWMKLTEMKPDKKMVADNQMTTTYTLMFGSLLVMAYVLAHFVWYAAPGSLTLFIAVKTAVWAWLGFVATYALTKFLFNPNKRPPLMLLAIDTGYYLATLMVMGLIFGFLR
ncbi:hypothetical protein A2872_02510 [Candidatus Gottesmanbacteria bacterium RIFCSPHIGHO2_01_FULL_42_12]|uniref:DUF1761 domain-containing protein n=1 Tax=Candidatus Gottesmanbacteria bacterium RIFCSPHIGHO2_01_FULL_42_12 TaxID=1798377 RepID=A0A1F5Z4T7_9BACT|nr:MAG: hypothetical protein A2872_02510 [Candidatus Gottesmanbacteria bacterium RIFCSPHIGHO2_01_FULL_42_12]